MERRPSWEANRFSASTEVNFDRNNCEFLSHQSYQREIPFPRKTVHTPAKQKKHNNTAANYTN